MAPFHKAITTIITHLLISPLLLRYLPLSATSVSTYTSSSTNHRFWCQYRHLVERRACTHNYKSYCYQQRPLLMANLNNQSLDPSQSPSYLTSSSIPPVMSFSSHLKSIFSKYNDKVSHNSLKCPIHIIMGNEAGDADSIISSLALSHVKQMMFSNTSVQTEIPLFLPLMNIYREDMKLRRETVLLLQLAAPGITLMKSQNDFIYVNDESFQSFTNHHNDISVTLVDHNKYSSTFVSSTLQNNVYEIIDHHQDEGWHVDTATKPNREIAFEDQKATVGSTCTLITERLQKYTSTFNITTPTIDVELCLVLLGVILLDTMNMDQKLAKGTHRDESAIQFLIKNTNWNSLSTETKDLIFDDYTPDRKKLFELLQNAKFDPKFWYEMDVHDCLRIDYKRFETGDYPFGLSSVLIDATSMLSKDSFHRTVIDYMSKRGINMLGIMCMTIINDKPKREFILIGSDDDVTGLTNYLTKNEATAFLEIKLHGEDVLSSTNKVYIMKHFLQGNPKGSRKQVAPLLLAHFSK